MVRSIGMRVPPSRLILHSTEGPGGEGKKDPRHTNIPGVQAQLRRRSSAEAEGTIRANIACGRWGDMSIGGKGGTPSVRKGRYFRVCASNTVLCAFNTVLCAFNTVLCAFNTVPGHKVAWGAEGVNPLR